MTHLLEVRLKGALLLGGGRSREIHDTTLRRPSGEPYIPASALKGALREQLVRLKDSEAATRLFGGQGFRQDLDPKDRADAPAGRERLGGGLARVFLGDAELSDRDAERFRRGLGYTVRAQVSIDRRGRRAADERLFQREVVGSRGDVLVFHAPVDASLLDAEDLRMLEAAARAVFALGSSRSRGLGWVGMELKPSADKGETNQAREIEDSATLEIVLEAKEPLSLGDLPFVGNFQPTLDFLPASTVRGAVVTAAMRKRKEATDQSREPAFARLVLNPDSCIRFGDAAPLDPASGIRPTIAPLTVRVGKYGREKAGVADTLVRDYLQQLLADRGVYQATRDEVVAADGKAQRASRPGRWLGAATPERRVMTRLALEPASARGLDGALYSVELLERGTRFVATVTNAGPEGRELLADAWAVDVRAGHGRGQGYGRLRIVEIRTREDVPLRRRLEDFDAYLRGQIGAAASRHVVELASETGRYLAALLLTELVPEDPSPGRLAEEAFHTALGRQDSRLLHGEVRAGQRGGFDTTAGHPRPFGPVVQAGSVLLLTVPSFDDATLARLEALERHGAGRDRDRGFGALRFSDPIHCQGDAP